MERISKHWDLISYREAEHEEGEVWRWSIIEAAQTEVLEIEGTGPTKDTRLRDMVRDIANRGDVPPGQKNLEHYVVCRTEAQGMVVCQVVNKKLRLNLLYVPPRFRRQGRARLACLALIDSIKPDVVVVDPRTEEMEELLKQLRKDRPGVVWYEEI